MALAKHTIGAKIFGAFVAMSAIIGLTGLAGYGVLSAAGNIAVTTFDGPLMAINYASIATTIFALLLAAGITLLLRSRIVRPLRAAATVADRIAKGEMQTPIPPGGQDETGALLKSMTVMQDNIRGAMTREKELRRS